MILDSCDIPIVLAPLTATAPAAGLVHDLWEEAKAALNQIAGRLPR
jgi:hypothetical protein